MLEALHYSSAGAKRDAKFALPEDYFDGTVNEPVLHQAVKVFLNNQRQGTHATKTRSFVSGGNQKPWKQKGTGRARQGSTRAPHWRGGGTVFGPHPRDYRTDIPRKVKQLARRSALNARAREGALHVVERFAFRSPKTAQLARLLDSLGIEGRKALVLTAGQNDYVYLSGRNLPTVEVMPYPQASAYDILWSDAVVVEEGALTGVMPEPLPDEPEEEVEIRRPRVPRAPLPGQAKAKPAASEDEEKPAAKARSAKSAPKPRAKAKAAKPAPSRGEGKTTAKKSAKKSAAKPAKPAPKGKGKK
ncbi:MAG: 50S ribosomal protein L4 [Gemmatimonadales bacterium]